MPSCRITRIVLGMATLIAVAAPVFAAGAPACCVKTPAAATASHGCCPPAPAAGSASKGCCKAPEAPKPEAKRGPGSLLATIAASIALDAPAALASSVPDLVVARAARHEHRAASPDDSPPDRLTRNRILLI